MESNIISLENIRKYYDDDIIIRNLNLDIKKNEFIFVDSAQDVVK